MALNRYMKGTKLDMTTAVAVLLFLLFVVLFVLGPARTVARARNDVRVDHVRSLMTAALQLKQASPFAYAELVQDLRAEGDMQMVVGEGSCAGDHGRWCSDMNTSDTCLDARTYFSEDFLPEVPVDPRPDRTSTQTGYYLRMIDDRLEIGACEAWGEEGIVLTTDKN